MKNLLSLLSLLAVGLVLTAASSSASNLAADNSALYGGNWTDGSNNGTGFGAWAFDGDNGTGGGFGTFIGGTGLAPSSFGIFSFPADSGAFAGVTRPFTGGPLAAGQTFSISLGYNGIAANGLIGLDFRDSSNTTVFSLQADGSGDWQLNDGGGGNFDSGAAEAANTPFVFTLTYNGGSSYSYTIGAGAGIDFNATNDISDITNIRLFSFQQGDDNNFGFDNLSIVPEPSTWAMMIGGLGMLTLLRRRRS